MAFSLELTDIFSPQFRSKESYLFLLLLLVTQCFVVAVQPFLEWIPVFLKNFLKEWSLNMFLTFLEMKTFLYQEYELSVDNLMAWRSELSMMNIIHMTLKSNTTTLKNLTEMKEVTLNYPKCSISKSVDTLLHGRHISPEKPYYINYRNISSVQSYAKLCETFGTCFYTT